MCHPRECGHHRDLGLPGRVAALHINVVPVPERTKDLALFTPQLDPEDLFEKQNKIIKRTPRSDRLLELLESEAHVAALSAFSNAAMKS